MAEPHAQRPYMPGYGVLPAGEGTGLLPWSWALERLTRSHDYWLATIDADGRPHVMPVWGFWNDDGLWISTAPKSRKARNLERDGRCTVTTDDAQEPVVVQGVAERVTDRAANEAFKDGVNGKYETSYDLDFFLENATYVVRPSWAFGLMETDFGGSPTAWRF
jgi:PPOX class probable F420-dependent enzyme